MLIIEPHGRRRTGADHRHRADGAEVLRRADSEGDRWQTALLNRAAAHDFEPHDARPGRAASPCCALALVAGAGSSPARSRRSRSPAARAERPRIQALQQEADALAAPGAHAARRSAEARARARPASRGEPQARRRGRRPQAKHGRRRAAQIERSSDAAIEADRPSLERRLVEVYKLGPARLLAPAARRARRARRRPRRRGDRGAAPRSTSGAWTHSRTLDELARARPTPNRVGRRSRAAGMQAIEPARRPAGAVQAADARAALVRQIDAAARSDGADGRRTRGGAAAAAGAGRSPGDAAAAAALPIKPFRGALDWPVRGRARSRGSAGSRTAASARHRPERHRDGRGRGHSRCAPSTRDVSCSPTSSPASAIS